ncbi:unnamed protein product [Chrysodeixis includens]|uniref:RING-type domain-containing protein n=1 Tax=Chrysodeixis includens TaxID=689277 RepID=A0A9P0BNL1_CHRIL|nr:unnamed protein product [Chrysodeixis includens]
MNNLDIDQSIEHVKNIIDNIRCAICDKLDGSRTRYSCGHAACNNCLVFAEECRICLSPTQSPGSPPQLDNALTQRVKNATALLHACQDLFNVDVFQRKRLSEQLRIEKELFPKCIQAPVKYENKRKSSVFSKFNKENRSSTYFPGEETSSYKENIMESSVSYVQKWLNKNEKDFSRKPFKDLNVNVQQNSNARLQTSKNSIQKKEDEIPVLTKNRKRSHFKTTTKNISTLDKSKTPGKFNKTSKRVKKELQPPKQSIQHVCENDESGIFMDEPIEIEDSQESIIDKDKKAWLAVIEAHKNESTSNTTLELSNVKTNTTNKNTSLVSSIKNTNKNQITKIPFYKKGYITETCKYCNDVPHEAASQPKEVEITIDSHSFTTTIKVLRDVGNKSSCSTNSVSVQTDLCEEFDDIDEEGGIKHPEDLDIGGKESVTSKISDDAQSEDLFADEVKKNVAGHKNSKTHSCVIIEESDSDTDIELSGPVPVKVDVHRSCDISEYGVLSEVENIQKHDTRPRRGPRGLTPTSTDSSEKENFNPNRVKKQHSKKKKYSK